MVNTGNPMPQKSPLQVEKEFRSFLHSKSLKLASLTLPQAVDAMVDFWSGNQDFEVLSPNGDGLAAYEDVTDNGRGTRLEIGLVRLLRALPESSEVPFPTHRLRLRLCYKWDIDVIRPVLPAGTWSYACWDAGELDAFKQAIFDTPGFSTMREKKPAEVNVSFETVSSVPHMLTPEPAARQMWWGVM